MINYEPKPNEKAGKHPDLAMEVDLYVHEVGDINIFHNKPFQKELSWIEFDVQTNKIDFVMDDGDLRDFGIPIDPKFSTYLQNTQLISVVLFEDDEPTQEVQLPLITHGGL